MRDFPWERFMTRSCGVMQIRTSCHMLVKPFYWHVALYRETTMYYLSQPKTPKKTNDQAFEWVLQDLQLKNLCVWTHSLIPKRHLGFQGTRTFASLTIIRIGCFEKGWIRTSGLSSSVWFYCLFCFSKKLLKWTQQCLYDLFLCKVQSHTH